MDDNHYVSREEFAALVAMAQGQQRRKGSATQFFSDVCQMLLLAGAIVGGYFLIQVFIGAPAALPPTTNAQSAPTPYPTAPRQDEQPSTFGVSSLPSCAAVTDTRTACEPVAEGQAQPLPTEPPAPTATPAYYAVCWTVPGERPCWLPPDAPWQPLEEAPATPLVAVEEAWHAPMVVQDVCADWHPPAPYPAECE